MEKPGLSQVSYFIDSLKETSLKDELDLLNAFKTLTDNLTKQQLKFLWSLAYNGKKQELIDNLILLGVKKLIK